MTSSRTFAVTPYPLHEWLEGKCIDEAPGLGNPAEPESFLRNRGRASQVV